MRMLASFLRKGTMQILRIEIKKLLYRRQFWTLLVLLLVTVFLDFVVTCHFYQEKKLTEIPSAYELMIINNYESPFTGMLFSSFLFFLIAPMMGSDLFLEEIEKGIHNDLLTRTSRKQIAASKGVALMIVVFCAITFCLLISQILAVSAFPLQGNLTSKITYNELMNPDKNRIFSYFQNYMPYMNSLIFIVIRGITGAAAAFLAFSLTMIPGIKKYILLLVPMLVYIVYSMIMALIASNIESIPISNVVETNILAVNGYGSIWMDIGFLLLYFGVGSLLLWKGMRRDACFL